MARIQVSAGKTLLESYIKTPPTGICELVWNAFDEDAKRVEVVVERSEFAAAELVSVIDDGNGMNLQRARTAFSKVGDSWKLVPGTTSQEGRQVHGRYGRGRYSAFSVGSSVRWTSTAEAVESGELRTIEIRGSRASLDSFDVVETGSVTAAKGTSVTIGGLTAGAVQAFDDPVSLQQRLLTEFALHLERHDDFTIEFLGSPIDPSSATSSRITIDIANPEGTKGPIRLTVIEWNLVSVERHLYLCSAAGMVVDEMAPGIQAVGAEFTAYLAWDGFAQGQILLMEDETDSAAGRVVQAGRSALKEHLAEYTRRREAETVARWKAEGVYPYKGEPSSQVERATRDTFNVVALAASRTVDETKTSTSKALALSLLKETFESNPEALLPILKDFSRLPANRIDELRDVLEHTTLTQLIALGKAVGNRVDFINGLSAVLFDRKTRKKMLERRQLHRILAHETWIFGEEWSLTGDDERLTQVLKKYLIKLGQEVELADMKPVLRADGSDGIPDLVLGRQLATNQNHYQNLVVELKRPSHTLTDDDIVQLRSYASAITNDERFDQPNTYWDFWLVGNDFDTTVEEQMKQDNLPYGVVQRSKRYSIHVRNWAEIIGNAQHRLKFVQRSLQYESDRDSGLAAMREKYRPYLPEEALGSPPDSTTVDRPA